MGEHLMSCGNKTDQCPKCRRFVRRAIFAYHFENNCTDLDAFDGPADPVSDRSNASSSFQHDNRSQSSSRLAAGDNNYVPTIVNDVHMQSQTRPTVPYQSNSGRLIYYKWFWWTFCKAIQTTMVCPFCGHESEIIDGDRHRVSIWKTHNLPLGDSTIFMWLFSGKLSSEFK